MQTIDMTRDSDRTVVAVAKEEAASGAEAPAMSTATAEQLAKRSCGCSGGPRRRLGGKLTATISDTAASATSTAEETDRARA